MNRHVSRAAIAATSLACVLSLVACTTGSSPIVSESPTPMVSASPSPSPSPSATPLTDEELLALLPPDASYPDIRGAIATARFFLEEYNRIYLTGDFRMWDALSGLDCVFCESSRSGASALHTQGGYRDGGEFVIDENATQAHFYDETSYWYVIFDVEIAPTTRYFLDGTSEESGGSRGTVSFEMYLDGQVWRISDVGTESTDG